MATGGVSLVPRALVIALGGVGRQIMVDVRRRMCERFGGVEEKIPCQQYVYLDTDATEMSRPEATLLDPDAVNLPASQKIHLSVTPVRNLRENFSDFPHLKEWLSESALIDDIVQGAGAVRSRGRLALSWNIEAVRRVVLSSWEAINATDMPTQVAEKSENRARFHAQLPARVYLLLSLRGGTGSGIFIDLAYLLRKWLGTAEYRLIGMLVLPGREDAYAESRCNAYAALRELNHWNYPDTVFYARYGAQSVIEEVGPTHTPPLNYAYLLEHRNRDGNSIDDRELLSMVAQSVFFDLAGEDTSAYQGAFRDNFDVYLLQSDMVGNPQHYLSLGLATIRFPKDRALLALLHRLASRVAYRLSHGSAEDEWSPENVRRKVETDLENAGLTLTRLCEQLGARAGGDNVLQDVRRSVDELVDKVEPSPVSVHVTAQIKRLVDDYEREKLGDVAIDVDPDRRNPADLTGYIRHIHERYEQLRKETSEKLREIVIAWVNDPRMRLSLALKALEPVRERLQREYSNARQEYDQLASKVGAAADHTSKSDDSLAERQAEACLQRLRHVVSSMPILSLPGLPWALFREAVRRYIGARLEGVRLRVERYLYEYAAELFDKLLGQVQALRDELQQMLGVMHALQQEWAQEADRAARPGSVHFGKEVWSPETELDKLFVTGAANEEQAVEAVVASVREKQGLEDDFHLAQRIASRDEKVRHDLFAVCRERFRGVVEGQDISERLMNLPTREQDVQQLLERQSRPYVLLRQDYPDWQDEPAKNTVLVGLSRACRREEDLMRMVRDKATGFDLSRGWIDVQDVTYFVVRQEICAFPIASMNLYRMLAEAYQRDTAGIPRYSRSDVEWHELTQPSSVSQFEAMKYLLAGWLGGVVEQTGDLDEPPPELGFRFSYTRFGQATKVQLPGAVLAEPSSSSSESDLALYYGPRERRMPKALASILQTAARMVEAMEALKAQVKERLQQDAVGFAVEVERRAGDFWNRYPVLARHFGPCTHSHESWGPLRLALDALWEAHGLGKRQPGREGTYTWEWSEEMRHRLR